MATVIQKTTLSSSSDIPFHKLVLNWASARRGKAGVSMDELAKDIAQGTLLQGLGIRPVLDARGAETGMVWVEFAGHSRASWLAGAGVSGDATQDRTR